SALSNSGRLCEALSMDHRINGGFSDTEENEFAVMPASTSSHCVVTTVTPVTKWPSARRKPRGSSAGSPQCDASDMRRPHGPRRGGRHRDLRSHAATEFEVLVECLAGVAEQAVDREDAFQ